MLLNVSKVLVSDISRKNLSKLFSTSNYTSQTPKVSRWVFPKVKPVHIEVTKSKRKVFGGLISHEEARRRKYERENFSHVDKETEMEFRDLDNEYEPDVNRIGVQYKSFKREQYEAKLKYRRNKVVRKNFREYMEPEPCFLTWAEKENIRYLHKKDPETWYPQSIADAFPVSVEGAEKLLKSTFRLGKPSAILRHDTSVKKRMELVKEGVIPLTPEIRRKLSIRENMPFTVGAPSNGKEVGLPMPVKPLGEFARIVASPEKIQEMERLAREAERAFAEIEESQLKKEAVFMQEMKNLRIKKHQKLTLSQFEDKLNKEIGTSTRSTMDRLKNVVPEVNYLVNLKPSTVPKSKIPEEEMVKSHAPTPKEFVEAYNIPKFKPKEERNSVTEVEGNEPKISFDEEKGYYIYDPKTGYQQPFGGEDNQLEQISIPSSRRVPGGVYKYGNAFYDENGEFLYRVF